MCVLYLTFQAADGAVACGRERPNRAGPPANISEQQKGNLH